MGNSKFVLIAGGGKYGKKAIEYVKKQGYKGIVIDSEPNCAAANQSDFKISGIEKYKVIKEHLKAGSIIFLNSDISVINKVMEKVNPKYIIPVVPVHLTLLIIKNFLTENSMDLVTDSETLNHYSQKVHSELLLGAHPTQGTIYLSYAKINETCPDNCPGPSDYCPNFKREKPITITAHAKDILCMSNLFKLIKNDVNQVFIVNESHQLMPGLGGLRGNEMKFILDKLKESISLLRDKTFKLITATTCNCHGVLSFFKKKE
ncbi:MAG: hypothetical protein EU542_04430 [Promethearchaeota archaeon]|nr:MAG: hypothetical protein EU542_04430 [Candidatus Lokiarchaeota archaeon]